MNTYQQDVYRAKQHSVSTWSGEGYDSNGNAGNVAIALLPALLILSAATGLLVALL